MLGVESSEATFLFRQLLLRVQQLHMNPVARVFLSLGQLSQGSHKFLRTLYMPPQCATYHGDLLLVHKSTKRNGARNNHVGNSDVARSNRSCSTLDSRSFDAAAGIRKPRTD
jgi:hypothetical protein